jgi:hypothetical protein
MYGRSLRAIVTAAVCWCVVPASAQAAFATHYDIRGTWTGFGGTNTIEKLNLCTGKLSGSGGGGSYTWPITGYVKGNRATIKFGPYNELQSYTDKFVGTIGAGASKMSGTASDSNGYKVAQNAVRTSGPPSTPPDGAGGCPGLTVVRKGKKERLKRKIGPIVSCGIDACIANVSGVLRIVLAGGKVLAAPARTEALKLPHTRVRLAAKTTSRLKVRVPGKILKRARAARKGGAKLRATFKIKVKSGGRRQTLRTTIRLT